MAYLSCNGTIAPNIPPPRTLASRSMACFFRPPCSSLCRPRSGGGPGRAGFPSGGFDGSVCGSGGGLFPGGSQRDQTSWSPARVPSGASGREERARRLQGVEGTAAMPAKRALHRADRCCARTADVRPRLPPLAQPSGDQETRMTPLAQVRKGKKKARTYIFEEAPPHEPRSRGCPGGRPSLPRVDDDRVLGVPRACYLEGLEQPVLAVPLVRARVRVRGEG